MIYIVSQAWLVGHGHPYVIAVFATEAKAKAYCERKSAPMLTVTYQAWSLW